jgi:soluble lytic murein transglycosylase-like protein
MKYIIVVLLSALFAILSAQTAPALTNKPIHHDLRVKTTASAAPTLKSVQAKPEKKVTATASVSQSSTIKQTTPAPAPQPQVVLTGCSSYRQYFNQYSWNVNVAEAICEAESRGNPNAISPINYDGLRDYGLMQLHGEPILDPASNIAAAYHKYQVQGWEAWTTYNKGIYLSYLD